jgi:diadenylate cyclase
MHLPDSFDSFWANAKNIFGSFNWTDAVDILLLAFLFYFVFAFCRGRKAFALIMGIIVLFVLYIISVIVGLSGIEFILSGIFKIGVLAFIIIFQPEIRDLLETMGSGSIKGIKGIGD